MGKKYISILLAVALALTICATGVQAAEAAIYTFEFDGMIGKETAQFELFPDTDFLPVFNFDFMGEGVIASMFGAEQLVVENNPPFTRGLVLAGIEELDLLPTLR